MSDIIRFILSSEIFCKKKGEIFLKRGDTLKFPFNNLVNSKNYPALSARKQGIYLREHFLIRYREGKTKSTESFGHKVVCGPPKSPGR